MNVWRPVELALAYGARAAWPAFQAVNRQFEGRTFQPAWAAAPLMKRKERTRPQFGWPRTTDSLCPTCVREAAQPDPLGRTVDRVAGRGARRRDQGAHRRARRQDRHREDLPGARHLHRHAGDQPGVPRAAREPVSRARLRRGHRSPAQPRHVVDQARARRGADHRPDQPLQHDVRSVLHGRQPGRLRPRADAAPRSRSCSTMR